MLNQSIKMVLVEPSHPGNIGSTARAMKTMGFSRLCLVRPKHFPDTKAFELASGAQDVLEQAQVVETLDEALADAHQIYMTSARLRSIGPPVVTPEAAAQHIPAQPSGTQFAFVFGRERTGLYKEEILKGHFHIEIPTNPEYRSLNLSQAVQIVAYELSKHALTQGVVQTQHALEPPAERATHAEVDALHQHISTVLTDIGFIKSSNPKLVLYRVQRLLNRVALEPKEVNILRGILTEIERLSSSNHP